MHSDCLCQLLLLWLVINRRASPFFSTYHPNSVLRLSLSVYQGFSAFALCQFHCQDLWVKQGADFTKMQAVCWQEARSSVGDRLMTYSVHLPSVFKYFVSVTFALDGCWQLKMCTLEWINQQQAFNTHQSVFVLFSIQLHCSRLCSSFSLILFSTRTNAFPHLIDSPRQWVPSAL